MTRVLHLNDLGINDEPKIICCARQIPTIIQNESKKEVDLLLLLHNSQVIVSVHMYREPYSYAVGIIMYNETGLLCIAVDTPYQNPQLLGVSTRSPVAMYTPL